MIHGLWTGYGIVILNEMGYGPDLDKDSDPSGPKVAQVAQILLC